jgi:Holliday junction resolvase
MSSGRSAKWKGVRIEREVVQLLCELGLPCARVPFSGGVGGAYSGDIDLELCDRIAKIQVKARREFRTLYRWLNGVDLLFLKADHCNPLVVMPIRLFAELATSVRRGRA